MLLFAFMTICSISFGQDNNETVTDIDGYVYHTVTIGTQTWMAEDLKVTKYNSGAIIQNISDDYKWRVTGQGAYCWYNSDIANKTTNGALYNWYTVNTGNLAPKGWHVPSEKECRILIDFLGGEKQAGGKMKEIGTTHWQNPNTGATNNSGFTALPGGFRFSTNGQFYNIGNNGGWWSSTKQSYNNAWSLFLSYKDSKCLIESNVATFGFSVRCIKD